MTELEILRHNPLIDPSLHIWGWQIAAYLFLGGLAAGVMVIAGILRGRSRAARLLIFIAPIALSIGMFALFLDLENKFHVFRFYTAFRITSPMSWGSWILLLIYPATLLYGLVILSRGDGEGSPETKLPGISRSFAPLATTVARVAAVSRKYEEALRKLNIGLGTALGAYTGILLGTLTARAAWSSLFLAPLFLVSGISAGAGTAMLLPLSESERDSIRRWDLMAIAAEAVVLGLFFLDLKRSAAALFFGGPYTAAFWSLVVIAGLLMPAALEWIESRRRIHVVIAPALILIGGLALRWIFVLAGQPSL